MTVVIADTSPINYPILIGEAEILARLYHRIVMPEEVFAELIDDGAPPEVRQWTKHCPGWIEIRKTPVPDDTLMDLDAGEASLLLWPNWKPTPCCR